MSNSEMEIFYAYPGSPQSCRDANASAAKKLQGQGLKLKPWEELDIGGKIIIDQIKNAINESDVVCADLTYLNPNVLYEVGYAIAMDRRLWLVHDSTIGHSAERLKRQTVLSSLGYREYQNSEDIAGHFHRDSPHLDINNTLYKSAIEPFLHNTPSNRVMYLKERFNTEASLRITEALDGIPLMIDDPAESNIKTLASYVTEIYSSEAVIIHFTSESRLGHEDINARYAFIAGLSNGLKKPVFMLAESGFLAPFDYRTELSHYDSALDARRLVDSWVDPIRDSLAKAKARMSSAKKVQASRNELSSIRLGTYIAENETERLIEEYFVETTLFKEIFEGNHSVVVGRKGAGKTATLLKLQSSLSARADSVVCAIRPISYELEGITRLLGTYKARDTRGYAVESLWKYLIYTEIALAIVRDSRDRPGEYDQALVNKIDEALGPESSPARESFSIRIEKAVMSISEVNQGIDDETTENQWKSISESLHKGMIRRLKKAIINALPKKKRIFILVDNLDKTWGRSADLDLLTELLLGLLSAARRVTNDFEREAASRNAFKVHACVFLRSDIFKEMMIRAREPDKLNHTKIVWHDLEVLSRVIEDRYAASRAFEVEGHHFWNDYCASTVYGIETKDQVLKSVIPRPRDILFYVISALEHAINRKHLRIDEKDFQDALRDYSTFACDALRVEFAGFSVDPDNLFLSLLSTNPLIKQSLFSELIHDACSSADAGVAVNLENWFYATGFVGFKVSDHEFRFSEDAMDIKKTIAISKKYAADSNSDVMLLIHPAYWNFLEIDIGKWLPEYIDSIAYR